MTRWFGALPVSLALFAGSVAMAAPEAVAPANTPANTPPANTPASLEALRQQCIAAGREVQQDERSSAALDHQLYLLGRDADGRRRDLDGSRAEQAHLLGALEQLQRRWPGRLAAFGESAIDRRRGELLIEGLLPALHAEARALAGEYQRITTLHREMAAKRGELAAAETVLGEDRRHLSALIARRLALTRLLLPEAAGNDAQNAALGRAASNLADLIKRADAAADRRDKALLARVRAALPRAKAAALTAATADPTRPPGLRAFDPPHSALMPPVSAPIASPFGAVAAGEAASLGIRFAAAGGAEIVAPFDGRVIYAGPFRNLGVVLIIRHGDLYHSVLAGLGRAEAEPGEWVLAGEPVGIMPDAVDKASGGPLYFELRRDGRPVDPQPWLAPREAGHDNQAGDRKVRE